MQGHIDPMGICVSVAAAAPAAPANAVSVATTKQRTRALMIPQSDRLEYETPREYQQLIDWLDTLISRANASDIAPEKPIASDLKIYGLARLTERDQMDYSCKLIQQLFKHLIDESNFAKLEPKQCRFLLVEQEIMQMKGIGNSFASAYGNLTGVMLQNVYNRRYYPKYIDVAVVYFANDVDESKDLFNRTIQDTTLTKQKFAKIVGNVVTDIYQKRENTSLLFEHDEPFAKAMKAFCSEDRTNSTYRARFTEWENKMMQASKLKRDGDKLLHERRGNRKRGSLHDHGV